MRTVLAVGCSVKCYLPAYVHRHSASSFTSEQSRVSSAILHCLIECSRPPHMSDIFNCFFSQFYGIAFGQSPENDVPPGHVTNEINTPERAVFRNAGWPNTSCCGFFFSWTWLYITPQFLRLTITPFFGATSTALEGYEHTKRALLQDRHPQVVGIISPPHYKAGRNYHLGKRRTGNHASLDKNNSSVSELFTFGSLEFHGMLLQEDRLPGRTTNATTKHGRSSLLGRLARSEISFR